MLEESSTKNLKLNSILTEKGILLIDDYGHWKGSQKAVDEFFREDSKKGFNQIMWVTDYAGRALIKLNK